MSRQLLLAVLFVNGSGTTASVVTTREQLERQKAARVRQESQVQRDQSGPRADEIPRKKEEIGRQKRHLAENERSGQERDIQVHQENYTKAGQLEIDRQKEQQQSKLKFEEQALRATFERQTRQQEIKSLKAETHWRSVVLQEDITRMELHARLDQQRAEEWHHTEMINRADRQEIQREYRRQRSQPQFIPTPRWFVAEQPTRTDQFLLNGAKDEQTWGKNHSLEIASRKDEWKNFRLSASEYEKDLPSNDEWLAARKSKKILEQKRQESARLQYEQQKEAKRKSRQEKKEVEKRSRAEHQEVERQSRAEKIEAERKSRQERQKAERQIRQERQEAERQIRQERHKAERQIRQERKEAERQIRQEQQESKRRNKTEQREAQQSSRITQAKSKKLSSEKQDDLSNQENVEEARFIAKSFHLIYEQVRAVMTKSTSLFHRLVKEFDSERIITTMDEPAVHDERTQKKITDDDEPGDTQEIANTDNETQNSRSSEVPAKNSSEGQTNSDTQSNRTDKPQGTRTIESQGDAENGRNNKAASSTRSVEENQGSKIQQQNSGQNPERPSSHIPDRFITPEEISFMNDGEWLSNYLVDQCMKRLLEANDADARQKSLTILPEGIVSKQTEGPNAGNWEFRADFLNGNFDLEFENHFGVILDGTHFICYELRLPERVLKTWNGLPGFDEQMNGAIEEMKRGMKDFLNIPEDIVELPQTPVFQQKDGYNCGVACILEFENLLRGSIPNVTNLDDYRAVLREELQDKSQQNRRKTQRKQTHRPRVEKDKEEISSQPNQVGEQGENDNANPITSQLRQPVGSKISVPHTNTSKENNERNGSNSSRIDTVEKVTGPHGDIFERTEFGFECKPCKAAGLKRTGRLNYDFSKGTEYSEQKGMPKHFHNFKRNVDNHLLSESHKNAAYTFNPNRYPIDEHSTERERNSGRVLGRNAFNVFRNGGSDNRYPMDVTADGCKGLDVGELNHSRGFTSSMIPHLYQAVDERLRFTLNEPLPSTLQKRPFAVVADKVTPRGDTLQIIGLMYVEDGKLRPIQLDCRPVSDLTGLGTAQEIMDTLTKYFTPEELRSRCIGYAFDGQYFHLSVPKHLMDLLNVAAADRDFYSFVHDPAHVIELAGKEARDQHGIGLKIGVPWINNIVSTITRVSSKCKWGSGWSELKELFEDMKEMAKAGNGNEVPRLLRFKRWSDTRFSTYIVDVLESFRNNYPMIYPKLGRTQNDLFNDISHATFPMELCSLIDIYSVIGEASRQVQATYMFPWQVDDAITQLNDRLRSMQADMENSESIPTSWPKFHSCASEISETCTYKSKAVTINHQGRHSSRSHAKNPVSSGGIADKMAAVRAESAKHVAAFVENLESRRRSGKPRIFDSTRECFAMSDIWSRQDVNPPPCLSDLVASSQRVGLTRPEVTLEEMESQYRVFSQEVLTECGRLGYSGGFQRFRQEETDFYAQILGSSTTQTRYPDVANLLAASVTRTSNESVTESMGSMLNRLLRGRESLGLERQRQELFLNWNAPPNNENATHIIDEALDARFGGPYWHTHRRAPKRKQKPWRQSKTTDRLNDLQGHVSVPGRIRKLICLE